MSQQALKQRQNAALKHGRRSPVMVSLGKKFGCTKPELHEGTPGEYDPENCVYCQARWDHLLEVRSLLGSAPENLMERAATTKIDIDNLRREIEDRGDNPLTDKHYFQAMKLDLELAKYLADKVVGNKVNVFHHKAKDEDKEFMTIDVSRVEE